MSPTIIGISGKKRSGKDTIADYLVLRFGFRKFAWADSVKQSAKIIFQLTDEQLEGELKETVDPRWGKTPRQILQQFGTEACRNVIDQDIWIKSNWLKIETSIKEGHDRIVIPDCRFPNEVNFLKNQYAQIWRIIRYQPVDEHSRHTSETALDYYDFDTWIENSSSLAFLYREVENLISSLLG